MLDKARRDHSSVSNIHFIQSTFEDLFSHFPSQYNQVDVIYSNAALQWTSGANHALLLPRYIKELLKPDGTFAMQIPDTKDQPSHKAMRVAAQVLGLVELDSVRQARSELTSTCYRRLLRAHCSSLNMWNTIYCHELMDSDGGKEENPVANFFAGSGLGAYLEALADDVQKKETYTREYRRLVAEAYPKEAEDNATLLFMKRFFLVATK